MNSAGFMIIFPIIPIIGKAIKLRRVLFYLEILYLYFNISRFIHIFALWKYRDMTNNFCRINWK